MRMFGACPNCQAVDTMRRGARHAADARQLTCEACGRVWPDWLQLAAAERQAGRTLGWVDVEGGWPIVRVWHDRIDWPGQRPVVRVTNAAVMEQFSLGVCFAAEGGIEGLVDGEPVELRNLESHIGLIDEYQLPDHRGCDRVLSWYAQLLRILFEDVRVINGQNLGAGRILKLDPTDPNYERDVLGLLWLAMFSQTNDADFPHRVFRRLEELNRTPAGMYLAGLTPSEVMAIYVPPPIARE